MRKIPTVFMRDENDRKYVTDVPNPACAWVFEGLGTARRKLDGTCVMLDTSGRWWVRREVKPGKTPPLNYFNVDYDETTQKNFGWEPVEQSAFAKWHAEALRHSEPVGEIVRDTTFELIGPKINGNPERRADHQLIRHDAAEVFAFTDRSYTELRRILLFLNEKYGYEGVVFHGPDGQYGKLKTRDLRP